MDETRIQNAEFHALYPLFIDLHNKDVLVVGAGRVALRKIETLVRYGARVRVIAPEACDEVHQAHDAGTIELIERVFTSADVDGCMLVIAATNDDETNQAVFEAASQANILVNVVDVPDLCTAAVPSVLQRGLLQIAVSTSGAAPSLSRRIRTDLEDEFPTWWQDYVQLLGHIRRLIKDRVEGPAKVRTPLFEALTDGRLQRAFAAGQTPSAEEAYATYIVPLLNRASSDSHEEPNTDEDLEQSMQAGDK